MIAGKSASMLSSTGHLTSRNVAASKPALDLSEWVSLSLTVGSAPGPGRATDLLAAF